MNASQAATTSREAEAGTEYPFPWTGYSDQPDQMPLAGYSTLLGAYVAAFGPLFAVLLSRNAALPGPADSILLGVATHKIGRLITRDWVTAPLRAPFTEYVQSKGGGEVEERSRGEGLRRAVGDLLTCPWCIAPWVAGGLYATYLLNRRLARLVAAGFTSVAVSDFLQHAYAAVKAG